MKFYTLALAYSFFNKGAALLTYPRYIIYMFGLASRDLKTTMIMGLTYGVSCFIIGILAYYYGFTLAEAEVGNQYNLFQKQLRKKMKIEKFK